MMVSLLADIEYGNGRAVGTSNWQRLREILENGSFLFAN
jgi:hypothetical protein